jgi:predicted MFS family arabinose efflux permease
LIAAASLAGMASEIALGGLADRRRSSGFPETALVLALGAVGYLVLATGTMPGAIVGTFLGYMFGWAFSGLMHLGAVTAHPDAPASATATLQIGVGVGLTVGPITFGALVDNSGYPLAWSGMAVLAFAAAGIFHVGAKRVHADVA